MENTYSKIVISMRSAESICFDTIMRHFFHPSSLNLQTIIEKKIRQPFPPHLILCTLQIYDFTKFSDN